MALREKLSESQLGAVAGGITYNNDWGDNSVYKVGKNGGEYTHTFQADDFDAVDGIICNTYDPSLSPEDNEDAIMQALIDSPYLSPL